MPRRMRTGTRPVTRAGGNSSAHPCLKEAGMQVLVEDTVARGFGSSGAEVATEEEHRRMRADLLRAPPPGSSLKLDHASDTQPGTRIDDYVPIPSLSRNG